MACLQNDGRLSWRPMTALDGFIAERLPGFTCFARVGFAAAQIAMPWSRTLARSSAIACFCMSGLAFTIASTLARSRSYSRFCAAYGLIGAKEPGPGEPLSFTCGEAGEDGAEE
jgi:hypothetical protein